jgi:hypothetical protein
MKFFLSRTFSCLLLAVLVASCSKKDNTNTTTTTKTPKEILMASQWKKSEYKENGTVMPFFGACEMDDILSFTATDWVMDDGATKCSTTTSFKDFYVIDADNKTMRWGYGSGELSFNSTNTSFTFKRTGANTFEYTFVKK